MALSAKQIRQVKAQYPARSPVDIAQQLGVPLRQVYGALNLQSSYRDLLLERCMAIGFMLVLAAPCVYLVGLKNFADMPQRAWIQIGLVGLLAATLVRAAGGRIHVPLKHPLALLCAAAVMIPPLLCAAASDRWHAGYSALHWSVCAAGFWVAFPLLQSRWRWPLLYCLAGVLAVVTACGLGQCFFGWRFIPLRVAPSAAFGNPNMLAQYIALCLPLALGVAVRLWPRPQWAAAALVAVGAALLLWLTACRAAVLAVLVALCVMGWLWLWVRRRRVAVVIAVLCVLSVSTLAAVLGGAGTVMPTERIFGGSAAYRLQLWRSCLAMMQDRPLTGFGPGGFRLYYPAYASRAAVDKAFTKDTQVRRAHNDYLQAGVEMGVPGALLALALPLTGLGLAAWCLARRRGDLLLVCAAAGALSAWMVVALFSFPLQRAVPPLLLITALAAIAAQCGPAAAQPAPGPAGRRWQRAAACLCVAVCAVLVVWHGRVLQSERWLYRALGSERRGANSRALAQSRSALTLVRGRMDVLTTFGRACIATGSTAEGIAALEEVVARRPYAMNALFLLAVGYCNGGQPEPALAMLHRVLRIKPDFVEARNLVVRLKTKGAVQVQLR